MIYIDRSKIANPFLSIPNHIAMANSELSSFYNVPATQRGQMQHPGNFNAEVKSAMLSPLKLLFDNKCAYCETPLTNSGHEFDHFRPRSRARGLNNTSDEDFYWWLTYEWENIFACCHSCQSFKSAWFPIENYPRQLQKGYDATILYEQSLLINPCIDNPEDHFDYGYGGEILPITTKGQMTISLLKLDRHELSSARYFALSETQGILGQVDLILANEQRDIQTIALKLQGLEKYFHDNSLLPHLGISRGFIKKWFRGKEFLLPLFPRIEKLNRFIPLITRTIINPVVELADEKIQYEHLKEETEKILEDIRHVYLERIEIRNFKCFDKLDLELKQKSVAELLEVGILTEPWLLFLGENGVGKSSLLKAIALGLCDQGYLDSLNVDPLSLIRYDKVLASITIFLVGEKVPIVLTIRKRGLKTTAQKPLVNMLAYNAVRLQPVPEKLVPEMDELSHGIRIRNILDYTVSLIDSEDWLLNTNSFDHAALVLKGLLDLDVDKNIERQVINGKTHIIVYKHGQTYRLKDLSDGYQSLLMIGIDIMSTFSRENTDFTLSEGVVIIDEIGTHLHPRWKMMIVSRLRKAFPKAQFIVSSHDPLCLRGLFDKEVIVLQRDRNQKIRTLSDLPNPALMRVDQLLGSPYFGLYSTIEPEIQKVFERYYELLAKKRLSPEEEVEKSMLSARIPEKLYLGDSLREEIALHVIDTLLAQEGIGAFEGRTLNNLKDVAKERVRNIWQRLDDERLGIT